MKFALIFATLTFSIFASAENCYTGSAIGCLFEERVGVNYAPITVHNPDHMGDWGNAVNPNDMSEEVTVTLSCPYPQSVGGQRDCYVTEVYDVPPKRIYDTPKTNYDIPPKVPAPK